MRRFGSRAFAIATLAAIVCAAAAAAGTLQGSAFYRERIALPPDAVFEAELQDVSLADAPAKVLGRARIEPAGHPPYRFEIRYDDAAIRPGRRYSVRASITQHGRLLFTTDRHYAVLDGGTGPLNMLLVSVPRTPLPNPRESMLGTLPASFEGEAPGAGGPALWHLDLTADNRYQLRISGRSPGSARLDDIGRWMIERGTGRLVLRGGREGPLFFAPEENGAALRRLDSHSAAGTNGFLRRLPQSAPIEPRLPLTGMFVYMADAASITLCPDGRRMPVALEADYKALEAAYLKARPQPRQALLVSVDGLIAMRRSMEESQPPRAALVVERFTGVWPRETCGTPLAESPLRNTYWKLVRLEGAPTEAFDNQREAHLIFAHNGQRVSGSAGCNRVTGSFAQDGDGLRIGQMAGTMMACANGMEQEQRFLQALRKVERYRIRGSHLDMLDAGGAVLARFEAVALR